MALPVHQIMAQLQEGVDAKGAEAEEKGELDFVFLTEDISSLPFGFWLPPNISANILPYPSSNPLPTTW